MKMTVEQYNAKMNTHFALIKEFSILLETKREAELTEINDYFNALRNPKSE